MAARITPEEKRAVARPRNEILAEVSEQNPQGLDELGVETLVTGGGGALDGKKAALGKWWKCVVLDLKMPQTSNPLPVRVSSDRASFYKVIRTNRLVTLPDAAINVLMHGAVASSKIRVRPTSPLYGNTEAALRANPGCEVVFEKGNMFLIRRRPRFAVERRELLPGPPAGPVD